MECTALDIACHLSSLGDMFVELFGWIWGNLLDGLAAVLALIPVPEWVTGASFTLPAGVLWVASALELNYGVSVLISAWTIRFIIRRIPVIG